MVKTCKIFYILVFLRFRPISYFAHFQLFIPPPANSIQKVDINHGHVAPLHVRNLSMYNLLCPIHQLTFRVILPPIYNLKFHYVKSTQQS